ncbi:MAG: site-2 protease family protein [Rhodospirillaceae bacterium]|nr:site-2 protease family protein [Rhodospirillaceae bacterium]
MFFHRITLFRLLGFTVRVDVSWLLLAALITWSLAVAQFPSEYPDLRPATYWWMGAACALGLLFSIVFHELSHALVARRHRMPVGGITLFIFGGVAEMHDEPTNPRGEFLMAVAGPVSSLLLAGCFYGLLALARGAELGTPAAGVLTWLGFINLALAGFNLVPAFPLDGGRMLRAALWGWRGDLEWATRIASRAGELFGAALIAGALVALLSGAVVAAMWYFLIGFFIRGAAGMAYVQTMTQQMLRGEPVRRYMSTHVVAVPPDLPVEQLIERYIYRHHFRTFPVVAGGRLIGRVSLDSVRKAAPEERRRLAVGDIMEPCTAEDVVAPDAPVLDALRKMQCNGRGKLVVVEGDRPVGILTLRDMITLIALRLDLQPPGRYGRTGPFGRAGA